MDHQNAPVLISGAGPTGMMLALWLLKYNVPFRIVDKLTEPSTTSRAIVMHARTLELYRMLGDGLDEAMLKTGTIVTKLVINSGGSRKGEMTFGNAGDGISKFPFVLSITQDEHEAILLRKLQEKGVRIERGVETICLKGLNEANMDGGVQLTLRSLESGTEENMTASYVVGCDGAHSGVRKAVDIPMEGGTYNRSFFIADIYYSGDKQTKGEINICVSSTQFVVLHQLPHKENRARLIGFVPEELEDVEDITFEDCQSAVRDCVPNISVDEVRWFSRYKVHHRCAASFQTGYRIFLCGDSAHLHSPVGGQGMNTGLGDVSNLAWKIATAWHVQNDANKSDVPFQSVINLLNTYSPERRSFAEELVESNDRLFSNLIGQNIPGWMIRNVLMPWVFPLMTKLQTAEQRKKGFIKMSQCGIEYRSSPLSESQGDVGESVSVQAGDRLPWIQGEAEGKDNFAMLDGAGWQAHVFGTISEALESVLVKRKLPTHSFSFTAEAKQKGFANNTLYLIRPDGYIGLILECSQDDEQRLEKYASNWAVGCPSEMSGFGKKPSTLDKTT